MTKQEFLNLIAAPKSGILDEEKLKAALLSDLTSDSDSVLKAAIRGSMQNITLYQQHLANVIDPATDLAKWQKVQGQMLQARAFIDDLLTMIEVGDVTQEATDE